MRAALVALLIAGCPSKQSLPPPGPYDPDPTPEPTTACPEQAAAARIAREAVLDENDPALREAAAEKVFAHAECEHLQFDAMRLDAEDEQLFKDGVARLKQQLHTTENLYLEAVNYTVPRWSVGGHARSGDLYAGYANKLRKTEPGLAISDPSTRALWFSEMEDLARQVDAEAAKRWDRALALIELGPPEFAREAPVAAWARAACLGLARVDPSLAAAHPICS